MTSNISDDLDNMARQERLKELSSETGIAARRARYNLTRPSSDKKFQSCPKGHPYDAKNTLFNSSGGRTCLKCLSEKRVYKNRPNNGNYPVIQLSFNDDGYQSRSNLPTV